ncbi:MAG: hypothetical protein V4844_12850 [Pseudomonadota bacterium]
MIQYYPQATVIPTVFFAAHPRIAARFAHPATGRFTFTVGAEVNHG